MNCILMFKANREYAMNILEIFRFNKMFYLFEIFRCNVNLVLYTEELKNINGILTYN